MPILIWPWLPVLSGYDKTRAHALRSRQRLCSDVPKKAGTPPYTIRVRPAFTQIQNGPGVVRLGFRLL